jgi:hypothetical protein
MAITNHILKILPVAATTTELTFLSDTGSTLTSTLNTSIVTVVTTVILERTTTAISRWRTITVTRTCDQLRTATIGTPLVLNSGETMLQVLDKVLQSDDFGDSKRRGLILKKSFRIIQKRKIRHNKQYN